MRIPAALLLCLLITPALAGRNLANRHWGGPNFPFSCETVRDYRAQINRMSPADRSYWARKFNITRKQRRQAMACLKVQ